MVLVAGSAEIRNACSGTLGASARQPVALAALQRLMLVTDRMFLPPMLTTYALPVRGTSVKKFGKELNPGPWSGVACWFGGRLRQPEVTRALHRAPLMTDTVP